VTSVLLARLVLLYVPRPRMGDYAFDRGQAVGRRPWLVRRNLGNVVQGTPSHTAGKEIGRARTGGPLKNY
jgi:hypothetical protein